MDDKTAGLLSESFLYGAATLASAHLGFDLLAEGGLTKSQAKKFHTFITPLMVNSYARVKGDAVKEEKFKSIYETSSPLGFLDYLLRDEVISKGPPKI